MEKKDPKKRLKLTGLILNSIGAIMYLFTFVVVTQTSTGLNYPDASLPFLIIGVTSIIGTFIGVRDIKFGSSIILLSLPATFLIGVIFSPYLGGYLAFITYIIIPIPLPHSIFLIVGGILCLLSYQREIVE